ncbi:hypothetical protein C8R47DRAFT_1065458 [Mycena vitilis]|nr:hypothetical protein C8R47DRAFT_1065458 [Mycena vitilis]
MVNFLHNITALAGAAALCKIFDFKHQAVNLAFNDGMDAVPIISFPETPGAPNEDSVAQPPFFVSQAGAAAGFSGHYSQAVASNTLPTVFTMQAVNGGPAVNLIDSVTGLALTSWVNPDPTTWADPTTPVCSFFQSDDGDLQYAQVVHAELYDYSLLSYRSFGPGKRKITMALTPPHEPDSVDPTIIAQPELDLSSNLFTSNTPIIFAPCVLVSTYVVFLPQYYCAKTEHTY